MANLAKSIPSGITNGVPLNVTATSSGGAQTFHTAVSGTSSIDEIWLFACNTSSSDVTLTISLGDTSVPVQRVIPKNNALNYADGGIWVLTGVCLNNSKVLKVWAGTTAVINVTGYVITDS